MKYWLKKFHSYVEAAEQPAPLQNMMSTCLRMRFLFVCRRSSGLSTLFHTRPWMYNIKLFFTKPLCSFRKGEWSSGAMWSTSFNAFTLFMGILFVASNTFKILQIQSWAMPSAESHPAMSVGFGRFTGLIGLTLSACNNVKICGKTNPLSIYFYEGLSGGIPEFGIFAICRRVHGEGMEACQWRHIAWWQAWWKNLIMLPAKTKKSRETIWWFHLLSYLLH